MKKYEKASYKTFTVYIYTYIIIFTCKTFVYNKGVVYKIYGHKHCYILYRQNAIKQFTNCAINTIMFR